MDAAGRDEGPGDRTQGADAAGIEEKAAFHLALRARGVRDLAVLRAMERVPRQHFLSQRHAGLVARDLPVPIAGGQTATPAWLVAALLEALAVEPGHRVLQVGAGSGYATAILAQLGATGLALERVRSLAGSAATQLEALALAGIEVRWADGAGGPPGDERYDRIVVHACCNPAPWIGRLTGTGRLVCACPDGAGQGIARLDAGGGRQHLPLRGCRLLPLRSGLLDL